MLVYDVVPDQGAGPVRLGMTRQECRDAMPEAPEEFRKLAEDPQTTDAFHESSFQVFYDAADRVEYVELSRHGTAFRARFDGEPILELDADVAVALVARRAAGGTDDGGYAYVFPTLSLSLWRPILPEGDASPRGGPSRSSASACADTSKDKDQVSGDCPRLGRR